MPKLILSSRDFRHPDSARCIVDHLPCRLADCRVLFFPNEKATSSRIANGVYQRRLTEFGFSTGNIQVFDYFSPISAVSSPIDAIYISGGNTFGMMKLIRESGADQLIPALVRQGALYIGGSAGAHIASSSIAHVQTYDENKSGLTDFSGLGLFQGILFCHYTSERYADYFHLRQTSAFPVTCLTDAESLVLES